MKDGKPPNDRANHAPSLWVLQTTNTPRELRITHTHPMTDPLLRPLMNRRTQSDKPIRFWQQNVNKSLISQLDLLNNIDPKQFDFVFIQEPHIDFLNLTRANHYWTVVYPMSRTKQVWYSEHGR